MKKLETLTGGEITVLHFRAISRDRGKWVKIYAFTV